MEKRMKDFVELGDEDFAVLFPETPYTLGKKTISLKPLGLEETAFLMAALKADLPTLLEDFKEQGINLDNLEANMAAVGQVVIHRVPMVLAIMTGVHPDSILKMPILAAIDLFRAIVDINLRDQDFFAVLSAVKDGADKFNQMMQAGILDKGSRGQQHRSSPQVTRGKRSKPTRGRK